MRLTSTRGRCLLVGIAVALTGVGCQSDATRPSSPGSNISVPIGTTTGVSAPSTSPATIDEAQLPEREPDVTGLVTDQYRLTQPSDSYYDGMLLVRRGGGEPVVVGPDGSALAMDDLNPGDEVAVWVASGSGCAESAPVQCDVVGIRVMRAAMS